MIIIYDIIHGHTFAIHKVLHPIHFEFLLWNSTKYPCRNNRACWAPQSEPRHGSTRARCGSRDADYVCLVYKCSSEQIPHFLAFPFLSLRSIYTDPHSDINSQQRAFWFCHIQGTVCWKMSLRAYGISVRRAMVVWACSFHFCWLGKKNADKIHFSNS